MSLLIKHPESHFPFWDDSVSSIWVEKRESRKLFLIKIKIWIVTAIIN